MNSNLAVYVPYTKTTTSEMNKYFLYDGLHVAQYGGLPVGLFNVTFCLGILL